MPNSDAGARRFVGKRVVVSGGATGVGASAARRFAREGGSVIVVDRNEEDGRRVVAELASGSTEAHFVHADMGSLEEVERAVGAIAALWDTVDVLFNHAGTVIVKPFLETSAADWSAIMNVNVVSMALMSRGIIPLMLKAGGGSIVITSSISGLTASPLESAYCVSKAACLQLARAIAVEFRDRGIRANAVCPGYIRTPHGLREIEELGNAGETVSPEAMRQLQGRICEPDEVTNLVVFLASGEASFINGAAMVVDNAATAAT